MLRGSTQASLRCGNQLLDLSHPALMGIINVTPDSFYPGSRVSPEISQIVDFAGRIIDEGASIVDIGGMSSRPGAAEIDLDTELNRVIPAIESVKKNFPDMIISLDTYRAKVAEEGIKAGATMINDISGGSLDQEMINIISKANIAYVLMHMRGNPSTMQSMTEYDDLTGDIVKYFVEKLRELSEADITDIIIDPGFGFSKTIEQNYELIQHLDVFNMLNRPLMIGVSRKSTLSKTIGRPIEETLQATSALHMTALLRGAKVLRVHDVGAARDVIRVYQHLQQAT